MCASCTQWLTKPSHYVQGLYVDIDCKQATCGLLGASKHVYGHQNTASKNGTRLKRRQCTVSSSSFIIRCTEIAVSLYGALIREIKLMIIELTGHAAENIDVQYERKLDLLQTYPYPD